MPRSLFVHQDRPADFTRFHVARHGPVTVVRLRDAELSDLDFQDAFSEQIMSLLAGDTTLDLVINFSAVEYCTTGIINALLSAKRRLQEKQGNLCLCELNPQVLDAFQTLHLDTTVFPRTSSESEAIEAVAGPTTGVEA